MKILFLWVTSRGKDLASRLAHVLEGQEHRFDHRLVKDSFQKKRPLVFIGACGIAVRAIAPYLRHKSLDPPVLVLDEEGRFVISLLSGHLGGANALAQKIAQIIGATPVITTASDIRGILSLDLWLQENNAVLKNWSQIKKLQAKLLEKKYLKDFMEPPLNLKLPQSLKLSEEETADFILTYRIKNGPKPFFHIRSLVLGVGFHAGEKDLIQKVKFLLEKNRLASEAIYCVATLDRRKEEKALKELISELGVKSQFFSRAELLQTSPPSPSKAQQALQIPGVAEPCALLASNFGPLLLSKEVFEGITLAVCLHRKFSP